MFVSIGNDEYLNSLIKINRACFVEDSHRIIIFIDAVFSTCQKANEIKYMHHKNEALVSVMLYK